ncbi:MAG: L-lactate dehydrogenase [Oscillospiraceae bacterium]|nr:L-lactate dehydrogenase [Oscillospiraceae bacterium]
MAINRVKTVILGAGNVGAAVAHGLALEKLCGEIVLLDINREKAWAEAEDLKHALSAERSNIRVKSGGYEECGNADIVILTAAPKYIPGQSRPDMVAKAAKITEEVIPHVMARGFKGFFVVVTNPVDVISNLVQKLSGLPPYRIIGTGTSLDTARLKIYIAEKLNVDPMSVNAFCMGEHGESQVIPWSLATVGNKPFAEIIRDNPDRLKHFDRQTALQEIKDVAFDIVNRKGSTTFGIASAACSIISAIVHDSRTVIPVSAWLDGEYGEGNVYAGVPAVIGMEGVKELVEYNLASDEMAAFRHSVSLIREYGKKIGL